MFTNWYKIVKGYVLYGFVVGLLFLALVYLYANSLDQSLFELNSNEPLLWALTTMPITLSIYAYIVGYRSVKSKDKIFTRLIEQIEIVERTSLFAEEIEKGELRSDFEVINTDDKLGVALLKMRTSLQQQAKEEENRNWIVNGVSEVSAILRNNSKIITLGYEIIQYIVPKIGAIQGAFFVVEERKEKRGKKREGFIKQIATYAYNRRKYQESEYAFGQGLIGQCALEMDIIHRTEIPDEYMSITSGLIDEKKPRSLIIIPLISEGQLFGIMEFAGFNKFTELQIKYLKEMSEIIARSIFNISTNENTLRLLEEVNKSQERTQKLLANASELITIYDHEGFIKYISPSVVNILGYEADELEESTDDLRINEEDLILYKGIFEELMEDPTKIVTIQYRYLKIDNSEIWLETTARNLFDNPAIDGLLFNTVDITERRQGEKEQRERAKMQALSENSPDIILRFDLQRMVSYVNPTIEKYTGITSDEFFMKEIDSLPVAEDVIKTWKEYIDHIEKTSEHMSVEMEFVNGDGMKLFMEVNAIPEAGEDGELESVLMVLHNITEAKLAELKVKEANQKVQDSINYAKRIQNSILPKEIVLKDVFKESFMLFRPKDIVSGDFPFIVQKGDYVYFSAVDCTGHGVPGALLSVIGSLILNEVVKYETPTPAAMLDHMHDSVVKTLRQGEEGGENERDGMDVGMCRVNLVTGEFMFSGAHRPLYVVRHDQKENEELEELKGDKYPIGGVQYRGREKFTDFETVLKKGDKVFVCSDGYPDQFGGPNLKNMKKIGPKKIRKLLVENKDKPMEDVHQELVTYFDEWMGSSRQMDDVLFIGIEF